MPSTRLMVALAMAGLSLGSGGCALVDGVRVTTNRTTETVEYCAEWKRDRKWADEAWRNASRSDTQVARSGDFAEGFREGYANYLYRGGNGEPPPLPPRHYRALKYQSPKGYQAIEDWFDGYRFGAGVARDSGCRELVTGPASGVGCGPAVCPPLHPQSSRPVDIGTAAAAEEPPAIVKAVAIASQVQNGEPAEPGVDDLPDLPVTMTGPPPLPHARITAVHAKPDPPDARPEP